MKYINFLFVSLLLLVCSNSSFAQEPDGDFTIKTQLRTRGEYRNGALMPRSEGDLPASFISNRARISLGYDNDFLSIGVSGQNISVWGSRPQIENKGDFVLNEAWAKLSHNNFFAQIGRQQLDYDDGRILGTSDWNQSGRWHDALKLGYEDPNNKLHLILAYNKSSEAILNNQYFAGAQPYKQMQTLWYQYIADKGFKASFILMNLGIEAGSALEAETNYMQTLGTNLSYNINDFNLFGTFYYQTGKDIADDNIAAYMWAVKGAYTFNQNVSLSAGVDYLSGQDDSDKVTAFNPLYGAHHKFYGAMDYFYASPYPDYGLFDKHVSLIVKPIDKLTLDLTYHHFSSHQSIYVDGSNKKGMGSEIDFAFTYKVRPYVTLQCGYSTMFGTEAFSVAKGGDHKRWQDWGWLSLNINPTIFKSK